MRRAPYRNPAGRFLNLLLDQSLRGAYVRLYAASALLCFIFDRASPAPRRGGRVVLDTSSGRSNSLTTTTTTREPMGAQLRSRWDERAVEPPRSAEPCTVFPLQACHFLLLAPRLSLSTGTAGCRSHSLSSTSAAVQLAYDSFSPPPPPPRRNKDHLHNYDRGAGGRLIPHPTQRRRPCTPREDSGGEEVGRRDLPVAGKSQENGRCQHPSIRNLDGCRRLYHVYSALPVECVCMSVPYHAHSVWARNLSFFSSFLFLSFPFLSFLFFSFLSFSSRPLQRGRALPPLSLSPSPVGNLRRGAAPALPARLPACRWSDF